MSSDEPDLTIDVLWDRLNDEFLQLYGRILQSTATVKWRAGHSDNEFYLLRAYASFQRVGRDDEEDLVIEVNVHRHEGRVTWTVDAGQSAGHVLIDGPTLSVGDQVPLSSWAGLALEQTEQWLRTETPNFIAYLNQEPTPYDVD